MAISPNPRTNKAFTVVFAWLGALTLFVAVPLFVGWIEGLPL